MRCPILCEGLVAFGHFLLRGTTINRTYYGQNLYIYLSLLTCNIWSYLLWPPVIVTAVLVPPLWAHTFPNIVQRLRTRRLRDFVGVIMS